MNGKRIPENDYSDIINLPHHVSPKHPRMSMLARAAQFAPFAALNGHEDAIKQTEQEHVDAFNTDTAEDVL